MASLKITITDAGRAEIINAQNTGTAPVEIIEIGVGTGQYVPDPTQTALQTEVKRISTISGDVVADDTIHVVAKDESGDAYEVAEFGLYTASGTLLAVYSQTTGPFLQKTQVSTMLLATDIVLETLDATSLTFGDVTFINPPATTEVLGVVELATATETQAGTDTQRAITPAALNSRTATENRTGLVEKATLAEAKNGAVDKFPDSAGVKAALDDRIADQATVDAGTNDAKFVTPKKLRWGVSYSVGSNGYVALPSWLGGVIFQWAVVSITDGEGSSSWPITFPNSIFRVISSESTSQAWTATQLTVTGPNMQLTTTSTVHARSFRWNGSAFIAASSAGTTCYGIGR